MKKLLTATCMIVAISCSRGQHDGLIEVGSYISEQPEKALAVLDSIFATGSVQGKEANARFALLYSMALDKNYIDVTDDSLINIAVDWYKRHGTANEKLKAYYYQGRIYQNTGDNESAMESFVRAEQHADKTDDHTAVGLLYDAMSNVSMSIFDSKNVLEYCRKAESHYRLANDTKRYAYALLGLAIYYTIEEKYDELSETLDTVMIYWDSLDTQLHNSYCQLRLGEYKATGRKQELITGLEWYIRNFSKEETNWLSVSEYYLATGNKMKALTALDSYRDIHENYKDNPVYYIHKSNAYDSLGMADSALPAYKRYQELTDSINMAIFDQDTKYLRDKHEKEKALIEAKANTKITFLCAVIALLILLYAIYLMRLKIKVKEKERKELEKEIADYEKNYSMLKKDRDELAKIIKSQPPIDHQSFTIMKDRLKLLNQILAASITSDTEINRKMNKELERLILNKKEFLYTTRMTFSAAHPKFIRFLEDKGLNEQEIEYCCLYVIGMKGKQIIEYMGRPNLYNESSTIRSKLGLGSHDTNIGNYVRNLLLSEE